MRLWQVGVGFSRCCTRHAAKTWFRNLTWVLQDVQACFLSAMVADEDTDSFPAYALLRCSLVTLVREAS